MTTSTIDPQLAAKAIQLAQAGKGLNTICDATGLLPNEVRLILDRGRQRANAAATAPAGISRAAARTAPTAPPAGPQASPKPVDHIAALIDQAEASDIAKVRSAAKRAVVAIDRLREVMAATEAERREKAAAKAKADKERADKLEAERVARLMVETLAQQLEQARVKLAEVTVKKPGKGQGGPGKKRNLSPETREKMRQNAFRTQALRRERRQAAAQTDPAEGG